MKKATIKFDEATTAKFVEFVKDLHSSNWGLWPDPLKWPNLGIGYTAYQQEGAIRKSHVTIVKFDTPVQLFNYARPAIKWAAGPGGRRLRNTAGLGF